MVAPFQPGHKGKVYAISGAASGIGKATALILAADGANLGLADLSQAKLDRVKAEAEQLGARVVTAVVDVRSVDQVEAWIKLTHDTFGALNGAVNSAGVAPGSGKRMHELDDKDWDLIVAVNLEGIRNSMRAQLKYLGSGSSLVNIASTSGLFGQWRASAYSASKHGVIALSKVAAKDYGAENIRVNALCPGPIITPLFNEGVDEGLYTAEMLGNMCSLKRCGEPEEIGHFAAFLLSDGASYMTGCAFPVDGGFLK